MRAHLEKVDVLGWNKSHVKLKRVFTDRIQPPLGSNHKYTFFTARSEPASTIHMVPTITNFFAWTSSMDPLTVKIVLGKINADQNENVSYTLKQQRKKKDTAFTRLCLI